MIKKIIIILTIGLSSMVSAQNDTSSPYSLYGLGVENTTYFNRFTSLGNSGIAYRDPYSLNNTNPAYLADIGNNTFLYELGVNGVMSNNETSSIHEKTYDFNFSHLALAFPIKKGWGLSFGLLPYTKVGYQVDISENIIGSTSNYVTNITGSGGLNKVFISNGLKLNKNINVGVDMSFLFGTITQEKWVYTSNSSAYLENSSYYNGFDAKFGIHYTNYKLLKGTTLGATLDLPTNLSGKNTLNAYKVLSNSSQVTFEDEEETDLDNFQLPVKLGIGISSRINKNITFNFDYKKNFWSDTSQKDNIGAYTNQDIYALGLEYGKSNNESFFWNNVKYRLGFNYDSGFLRLSNNNIDNYFGTIGLGMPLSATNSSMLNLSYSYGKQGTTDNSLILENYHKLTLNISLNAIWFKKKKIF
ncbi:hypothetical protein JBL43_00600 [Aureibaculum sp. A20]|uniref:Aromatic hydrocarbon degradation protein n=1 Tax=Aureibaculum flavum TaxID=2795986 RepID=A0ABS0WLA1_9FLAO|nr:hypothetical protein [Aureibaculum flavum]MBJ2172714.1 hypothetical protein [Aureibaculum flavum]